MANEHDSKNFTCVIVVVITALVFKIILHPLVYYKNVDCPSSIFWLWIKNKFFLSPIHEFFFNNNLNRPESNTQLET
jgi:hypothetical protein